jgi:flagellar hook-basal body complex protein FliE
MYGQRSKRFFMGMIAFSLIGPLVLLFWNPEVGGILLLLSFIVTSRCLRLLRMAADTSETEEQRQSQDNRGQTVFVQLVDDQGNDLEPTQVQARIAAAQLTAGPRDLVIGVRRKVT